MVGSSLTSSGELHAFRWAASAGIEDLGTLGGAGSKGVGANDLGQIVGSSSTLSGETHAFLWEDGVMYDLGTLSGTDQSSAVDINNVGQVIGEGMLSGGENHAVLWEVPLRAAIDIVPGTEPNLLKLGGKGKLQVAVLSSAFFDAAAVDPASLTLGNEDAQDTPITRTRKSQPAFVLKDVDGDGRPDLVATFDQAALVKNGDLAAGTTRLVLLGARKDGRRIRGRDAVVVS